MKVVVLGAGRVGGAIVRDLAAGGEFEVTVADASPAALARLAGLPRVTAVEADVTDPAALGRVLEGQDVVVGAVPGFLGFETVRRVLEAGKDIVDISFFPEDPFELDALAREKRRIALVDCGIAPGCSNLILGRMEAVLDTTERFVCLVGGLPVERRWPYEYKAPFSPIDVIEEYTRPARFRRQGEDVTLPALSEVELVDFPGVGTLEAFNTDGLRTLLRTCRTPTMVEKTLRYPGHAERMRMLRETGFFGAEPVAAGDARVRPLDVTAALLFEAWRLGPEEPDLTVMRVEVEGRNAGRRVRHVFDLLDRYDERTGTHSMARTTGYTCTAMVRMLARGLYREPGISPPEYVGRDAACFEFVMRELAARGVVFHERVEEC
ncbi:MAG TPA: saccharopine dehydrogenase C-terminal domain-containing protein [Longimicrobiales bacterium]